MCEKCNSIQTNASAYDPTRTLTLRNAFVRAMNKRFNELKRVIRTAIMDQDVFGLESTVQRNSANSCTTQKGKGKAGTKKSGSNRRDIVSNSIKGTRTISGRSTQVQTFGLSVPGRGEFAFTRSSQRVEEFMNWLEEQIGRGLLEIETRPGQLGAAVEEAWTNKYVRDSYKRGVLRARAEMLKAGYTVPALDTEQAISAALNQPFHLDRVGVLYTRVFSELKGITSQLEQQIARVLSQGMIDGDNPRVLARKLLQVIDGKGPFDLTDSLGRHVPARRRAEIMARTEIIRAHHHATIQEYKNWGVIGVRVKAEFVTAGDDRVCTICEPMEGNVYELDAAWNIIPVHPQCRCMMLPMRANETILMPERDRR